jgi:hypothetical protein
MVRRGRQGSSEAGKRRRREAKKQRGGEAGKFVAEVVDWDVGHGCVLTQRRRVRREGTEEKSETRRQGSRDVRIK